MRVPSSSLALSQTLCPSYRLEALNSEKEDEVPHGTASSWLLKIFN